VDTHDWQVVRDGIEAKQCVGPDGTETFVLRSSADAAHPGLRGFRDLRRMTAYQIPPENV
jgi:hypothetical protein